MLNKRAGNFKGKNREKYTTKKFKNFKVSCCFFAVETLSTTMTESVPEEYEIPAKVSDEKTGTVYSTGACYGKGVSAKCYELRNELGYRFAGKIISKNGRWKRKHREKVIQEIAIHKQLKHPNIVCCYGFFEDAQNIYIVLELCRKRSMLELLNRRGTLAEPETRYYMTQILSGLDYLHRNQILHRDLKLANLFLTDTLMVKIGDFGLATKIRFEGEQKKTLCGTPNYIAPEILLRQEYSFKVDVWSIGCVMYTLLVGKLPFQMQTINETYARIKNGEYQKPSRNCVSKGAIEMIEAILQPDPNNRPSVKQLLTFDFIRNDHVSLSLPVTSSLTTAPRFDHCPYLRQPFTELNNVSASNVATAASTLLVEDSQNSDIGQSVNVNVTLNTIKETSDLMKSLIKQLKKLLLTNQLTVNDSLDVELSDPEAHPDVWISKWVDYTDKYGFCYQLSNDCIGVLFNDNTKFILLANGVNVHCIEGETETYMTTTKHPESHHKKMRMLTFFVKYMRENLSKTGGSRTMTGNGDRMARVPHLNYWCRTPFSVIFRLTNGTVQFNFNDHNKIVLCPRTKAVTLINTDQILTTYRFATLAKHGCSKSLAKYLYYALEEFKDFAKKFR